MEPITSIALKMFSEEFPVTSYSIPFSQNYNSTTGKVAGEPVGDIFYLEIISNGKSNFVEWMIEPTKEQEGKLIFYSGNQVIKSITFEKGCLVNYSQSIKKINNNDAANETVITENLAISYQKIDFGDIDFEKKKKSA